MLPLVRRTRLALLLLSMGALGCLQVTAQAPDGGAPDPDAAADAGTTVPQGYCSPSGWCWEYPRPHGDPITGIWGPADAGGLFVTTSGGRVLEQTATGWKVAASIESGLTGIHGSGPNDIWAGGTYGACRSLHFDGTAWRLVEPPPSSSGKGLNCFMDFWALAPNDVLGGVNWSTGVPPLFFTWDGQSWNASKDWGYDISFWRFAGRNRSDLLAARSLTWLAWTPSGWESRTYGSSTGGERWWFTSIADAWTAGGERWFVGRLSGQTHTTWSQLVLRQDSGGNWSKVAEWPAEKGLAGGRIAGASATDLYVVSPEGLKHWDGTALAAVPAPFPDPITALWWDPRAGLLWAGGSGGSIASWNGSDWSSTSPEDQVFGTLRGLWCDGPEPVAVGDGRILARTPRGWKTEWSGAERLYAVWGLADGTGAWAVGDSGLVLRRRGEQWLKVDAGTQADLRAVWGHGTEVWVGGKEGTLLLFDGSVWQKVASPTQANLQAIWGSSKTNVWLAADDGSLWRQGPMGWVSVRTGDAGVGLGVLWGTGPENLWLARTTGFHHWDGTAWTSIAVRGSLITARAMAVAGDDDVLLAVSRQSSAESIERWNGGGWTTESAGGTNPRALCVSSRGEMWMAGGAVPSGEMSSPFETTVRIPAAILHKPAEKQP